MKKHLSLKITKFLLALFLALAPLLATQSTFARPVQGTDASGTTSASTHLGSCRNFIGFTSWDCNVPEMNSESNIKTGIANIASNIATDISVAAAYLVIGYVIYGGYLYMLSDGDPGKVASGKKTLTHAFLGLAITMSASVILGTIRVVLMNGNGTFADCTASANACGDASSMVTNLIQWVVGMAGVVAVIFVLIGGISYMTSAGDPGKVQKAKQTILFALIGLAIVALAETITAVVSNTIRNSGATGYYKSPPYSQITSINSNHTLNHNHIKGVS